MALAHKSQSVLTHCIRTGNELIVVNRDKRLACITYQVAPVRSEIKAPMYIVLQTVWRGDGLSRFQAMAVSSSC